MNYKNTIRGIFKDRPNRFIAHVQIGDQLETVHVKNTGRCRELLVPEAEVIPERVTILPENEIRSDQCEQGGPLDQYGFLCPK